MSVCFGGRVLAPVFESYFESYCYCWNLFFYSRILWLRTEKLVSVKGGCFGDFKCHSRELVVAGNSRGGLVMEKFWDAGIPCLHPPGVRRGGGVSPALIL